MRVILQRETVSADGIYGKMFNERGQFLFTTVERLYDGKPKIQAGIHPLRLYESPRHKVEVPLLDAPEDQGHGFEIDIANFPKELDGCIAVGIGYGYTPQGQINMVTDSKTARAKFMALDFKELLVVDFSRT